MPSLLRRLRGGGVDAAAGEAAPPVDPAHAAATAAEADELAELVAELADETAQRREPEVVRLVAAATPLRPYGRPGAPLAGRSVFRIGFAGALGAATAAGLVLAVEIDSQILVLVLLSLFLAVGLDPVVGRLCARGFRRGLAVATVMVGFLAVLLGFIATAVPALTREGMTLADRAPAYLHKLEARPDAIGTAARKVAAAGGGGLTERLSSGGALPGGVLRIGKAVLTATTATVTVLVLTTYLLASLPTIKETAYRLAPRRRRARIGVLTDEILRRVGGYLLGNLLTSLIAGVAMLIFLMILGVPSPIFLGLLVAIFDLVPMVGALAAGVLVALVALTVSVPVAVATVVFTTAFRLLEDYLLSPRIMKRTVEVPGVVTVIAVLIGGGLLGIIGALLAIPVAAALGLILTEVVLPRQQLA